MMRFYKKGNYSYDEKRFHRIKRQSQELIIPLALWLDKRVCTVLMNLNSRELWNKLELREFLSCLRVYQMHVFLILVQVSWCVHSHLRFYSSYAIGVILRMGLINNLRGPSTLIYHFVTHEGGGCRTHWPCSLDKMMAATFAEIDAKGRYAWRPTTPIFNMI